MSVGVFVLTGKNCFNLLNGKKIQRKSCLFGHHKYLEFLLVFTQYIALSVQTRRTGEKKQSTPILLTFIGMHCSGCRFAKNRPKQFHKRSSIDADLIWCVLSLFCHVCNMITRGSGGELIGMESTSGYITAW